jgi:hypothetical protein
MESDMAKSRTYHTLLSRDARTGRWCIEFGDYDRSTVEDELEDYLDHGYRRNQLRIIKTGDHQQDINAAVDALNAEAFDHALSLAA